MPTAWILGVQDGLQVPTCYPDLRLTYSLQPGPIEGIS
jgi:hypothetical protein